MSGPYRVIVDPNGRVKVQGPGFVKFCLDWDRASGAAHELNWVHHTARREAIEECVKVVEDQRRRTLDNDYHAAMTVIIDRLRAVMETEP